MDLTNYSEEECKIFNEITSFRKPDIIGHPIVDISAEMVKRSVARVASAHKKNSEVEFMSYIKKVQLLFELEKFHIIEKQAKPEAKYKAGKREFYFLTTEGSKLFRQGGFVRSRELALEKKQRENEKHNALLEANRISQEALDKSDEANKIASKSGNWAKGAILIAFISLMLDIGSCNSADGKPRKPVVEETSNIKEAPLPIEYAVVQKRGSGQLKNETRKSGDSARASQ